VRVRPIGKHLAFQLSRISPFIFGTGAISLGVGPRLLPTKTDAVNFTASILLWTPPLFQMSKRPKL
jgi:hypothetical protein